jgi:hypothetical protein
VAPRFRSNRNGIETPVQLVVTSLGVLLGQLLGLLQCKKPGRVRVECDERKQPRWALIREEPTRDSAPRPPAGLAPMLVLTWTVLADRSRGAYTTRSIPASVVIRALSIPILSN